ncbi:cytochrome P450 2J6-like [Amphibalanus amphitrite]|uniref:cytochrome P450 2J6-like n=1 Tax=Amphibalanus amphitrite TaxID=1232801 RepID=UPI001C92A83B|nr:cytochrome P450 2J6-like [Amphibalanus amphitrite]
MLVLVLVLMVLAVVVGVRIFTERWKNYPPGPFSIPFLGSLQQGRIVNTLAYEEFKKWGDQYGNLIFFKIFMDQPLVIVRGYDLISEASSSRALTGVGSPLTFREHGLFRRRGLIFTDGETWHEMRRFTVRTLHGQGFGRKQRTDNLNDELADVLQQMEAAADEGREVNARHLFTLAATNSLMQLVLGQKLARDGQLQHLIQVVDRNMNTLSPSFIHLELFPWLSYVAPELSGYRQFRQDVRELVDQFRPMVDRQKAAPDDQVGDAPPLHLLEAFVRQQRLDSKGDLYCEENLLVLLKDLFIAGMETTNTEMEWVLLLLAMHRDVQERAAEEVDRVIGPERRPAIDDMPAMTYLGAVLEEVLRFAQPVPVTQHNTTLGATQLGGYHIPADCRVMFDWRSVTHDPEFWGDPETFRPERFLVPDASRLRKRVLAFGLGQRHCIGEAHARQSVFLFTAGLLQRFTMRLSPGQGGGLDHPEPNLIMRPRDFRLTVERRQTPGRD